MPNAHSRALKAHDDNNNEGIRLQKILAQAGFGSRRKCEQMITDGRVEVDGELVTELGTRVDPKKQHIRVDGSRVHLNPNHVTLALNKPKKVLSAMDDPKGRYTLADIIGDKYERVFHMGRLDYDSEGLILMTNDGSLVNRMMRSTNHHEKEYLVRVNKPVTDAFLQKMASGVRIRKVEKGEVLLDAVTRPCEVEKLGKCSFRIVLTQGLNRQIRRMCETLGYHVEHLKRIRVLNIELKGMKPGTWRKINDREMAELQELLKDSKN